MSRSATRPTYGEGDPIPVDVNAQDLHAAGIRGRDIGVAIIDTGYWKLDSLDKDSAGNGRVAVQYDAVRNAVDATWSSVSTDTNGHGTHITSLIASSRKNGQRVSTASLPTRASFRSRHSAKTARAATPR